MKVIKLILFFIFLSFTFNAYAEVKIGIVVPMEHEAMKEIVTGFKETLQKQLGQPLTFKVANAQNDQNLQHSIIQQMRDADYDLIVTIATHTAEMAASIVKNKPIVCLAADISEQQRQELKPCNVAVVDDEIATQRIIDFIHQAYPSIKNMVIIHSPSEKIIPEVAEAIRASKRVGIHLKDLTIQNLPDLQIAARNLPNTIQAIFILKDSMVVSGIAQLAQLAKTRHIPLITSDEGSVKNGAGFAVGVREAQIGINGAELALQILQGKKACTLPINKMNNLFVFMNRNAMNDTQQPIDTIIQVAKQNHYLLFYV